MSDRSKSPNGTLTAAWDEHTAEEFVHKDVDATMRTMTAHPHVINLPVATGGRGWSGGRDFYAQYFIGRTPQNTRLDLISRTARSSGGRDAAFHSRYRDAVDAAGHRPDRPAGGDCTRRRHRVPRRQGRERAHLLGPAIGPGTDRTASTVRPPRAGASQAKAFTDPTASLNTLLISTGRQ